MRGRKPKPTVLKELAGNPGKRALNHNEPVYTGYERTPYAPRHLNAKTQREWNRVASLLARARVLTEADLPALEMYCVAWSRWTRANEELAKETTDWVLTSEKGGQYQTPWLGIASKAFEQMMKCLIEFGMTPSSRSRVHVAAQPKEPTLEEQLFAMVGGAKVTNDHGD